jgi:hypothetical protein
MGFSLSWLAVKGASPEAIREQLELRLTGEQEEFPESAVSAAEIPDGWYLIVADRVERVASDAQLKALTAAGAEAVTCFVEEHVMVSQASAWKDGQQVWLLEHVSDQGIQHLEVKGTPPAEFARIREELFAKQVDVDDCDYIFDVPVETAKSIAGYRYDMCGAPGAMFEVLAR